MSQPRDSRGSESERTEEGGRFLLVGGRRRLRRLGRTLDLHKLGAGTVVGYVDHSGRGRQLVVHPKSEPVPILGTLDRLAELADRARATHLVVALPSRPARRLGSVLEGYRTRRDSVHVHWVGDSGSKGDSSPEIAETAWNLPRPPWPLFWSRLGKRVLDVAGALAGLTILAPLFLAVAVAIWITSGRPIFYRQERVGQGGRIFRMWKFRSMRNDAEDTTGPIWAKLGDERCTKIGAWLRRTNVDELPQLWNVLAGEMSLVGPRPERPIFVSQFCEDVADYDLRHAMPMGMTGWAQVHGWRGRTSLRKRVQYDLDYIERWSLWLDLRILFMTVQHVCQGRIDWGASGGGNAGPTNKGAAA